jgi:hypothetical protein
MIPLIHPLRTASHFRGQTRHYLVGTLAVNQLNANELKLLTCVP